MEKMTIYLGTKNISSWSLRPWLALKHAGVAFDEILINLDQPDTKEKLLQASPSGKVPVLKHGNILIWDSLAICEYLAELFPNSKLWPQDQKTRAYARAISAEMHAGFPAMRQYLSMDIKNRFQNHPIPENAIKDIQRVLQIWQSCLDQNTQPGKFLFGDFTIADAMFAPVATRFITYDVKLPTFAEQYVNHIMSLPAMQEWYRHACQAN